MTNKASVSGDTSNAVMWLLVGVFIKFLGYYYTIHKPDDDVAVISVALSVMIFVLIMIQVHRMKVSRIKLGIEDGETEWSAAAFVYVISSAIYFAMIVYVIKKHDISPGVHGAFVVSVFLDVTAYVFFMRFKTAADDSFANESSF